MAMSKSEAKRQTLTALQVLDPSGTQKPEVFWNQSEPDELIIKMFLPDGVEILYGTERVRELKQVVKMVVLQIRDCGACEGKTPEEASLHVSSIVLSLILGTIPEYDSKEVSKCAGSKAFRKEIGASIELHDTVTEQSQLKCAHCKTSYPAKRCSCKQTSYCNEVCQRLHWTEHRKTAAHVRRQDMMHQK
jgi:MYND finger